MKHKYRSNQEKIKICKEVIQAQKNGVSICKTAEYIGINQSMIRRWINEYKVGKFNEKQGIDSDIPADLTSLVTEEFNAGSVKIKMVEVMVFSETVENHIRVSVEEPDIQDIHEYSDELNRRILDKLQWNFVVKGFSLLKDPK